MHCNQLLSSRLAVALVALTLGGLVFACAPAAAIPATPVPEDPFAVVRATSQAAYASGKAHLDRGELQQALIDLDRAKTNDPDNRSDIEQALTQTLGQLALLTPTPEPTSVPRGIVVATVAGVRPTAATPDPRTPGPEPVSRPTAAAAGSASGVATPAAAVVTRAGATAPGSLGTGGPAPGGGTVGLVAWHDPQGRFTLSAPGDWRKAPQPQSLIGTSVVQFRDPTAQAELDVAVDSAARAVSPELYSATLELAMQQYVPGYASEEMLPGSTSGNPSVRRVFTFSERDAAGADNQARGFQVTVIKGSTAYVISGSAPADQFAAFSATFDQMVETFRFS